MRFDFAKGNLAKWMQGGFAPPRIGDNKTQPARLKSVSGPDVFQLLGHLEHKQKTKEHDAETTLRRR